ncbi:ANTAR domain-containing protein [Rhodococcus jostii]
MERFDVDAVRAFEMLAKISQDSNTPVATVATRVVERGPDRRP